MVWTTTAPPCTTAQPTKYFHRAHGTSSTLKWLRSNSCGNDEDAPGTRSVAITLLGITARNSPPIEMTSPRASIPTPRAGATFGVRSHVIIPYALRPTVRSIYQGRFAGGGQAG